MADRFELLLKETMRSLEENGIKFMLKVEQKTAIRHLFEKKDLLAVLPTGYGKSLIFQLLVLLAKRAGNYASLLVITPLVSIINDQLMEVETMNLTACNLAQKLGNLEDIEGGNFNVVYGSKSVRWKVVSIEVRIDRNQKSVRSKTRVSSIEE